MQNYSKLLALQSEKRIFSRFPSLCRPIYRNKKSHVSHHEDVSLMFACEP